MSRTRQTSRLQGALVLVSSSASGRQQQKGNCALSLGSRPSPSPIQFSPITFPNGGENMMTSPHNKARAKHTKLPVAVPVPLGGDSLSIVPVPVGSALHALPGLCFPIPPSGASTMCVDFSALLQTLVSSKTLGHQPDIKYRACHAYSGVACDNPQCVTPKPHPHPLYLLPRKRLRQ